MVVPVTAIAAGLQLAPYIVELLQTAIHGIGLASREDVSLEELEGFRARAIDSEKRLDAAIAAAIAAKKAGV